MNTINFTENFEEIVLNELTVLNNPGDWFTVIGIPVTLWQELFGITNELEFNGCEMDWSDTFVYNGKYYVIWGSALDTQTHIQFNGNVTLINN